MRFTWSLLVGTLLLMTCVSVSASSSGKLSYCSLADNRKYGVGSSVMPWVQPPVYAPFYTIRTADTVANPITSIPASDPTTYIPNTWVPIHIRVHDLDKKFIGLVIYATNGAINPTTSTTYRNGTQVGAWKTTSNLPFWSPTTCGGTAMTHVEADLKPLHSVIYWRSPPGTGRVSFHVMIKQGEQGKGNFYYPQYTLSLNEATVPTTPESLMVEAQILTSCAATCQAHPTHTVCNAVSTSGISSAATFSSLLATAGQSICRPQVVSGCMATSPQRQPADICAYKSSQSDCLAQGRTYQATTCIDISSRNDTNRFCVCAKPSGSTTSSPTTSSPTTKTPTTNSPTTKSPTSSVTTSSPTTKSPTSSATTTSSPTTKSPTTDSTKAPTATPTATLPPSDNSTTDSDPTPTSIPTDITSQDPTPTPTTTTQPPRLGAASSQYGHALPLQMILAITTLILSGSRHAGLVVLLVCGVFSAPLASAHNYVMSPSRALVASVSRPCEARVSPYPHIQVIPGQSFPMEWSVGHGDSRTKTFYWILVHADDYQQLSPFTLDSMAEDYINNAPASAWMYNSSSVGSHWAKRHVGNAADGNNPLTPIYSTQYFDRITTGINDTDYITRDAIYREKSIFSQRDPTKINQWIFLMNQTRNDARVAYRSVKYPWIRAVHRFYNGFNEHEPYAKQADIANFEIPPNTEPGNYIYHFKWAGYRDCVDIDVRSPINGPVVLPFGKNKTAALAQAGGIAPFVKLDHCEYTFVLNPMTSCRILPKINGTVDASQCVQECSNTGQSSCTGVQLVRATNPPTVTLPYAPNIPYYQYNTSNTGLNYPCDYTSVNEREKHGCRTQVAPQFNGANPTPAYSCSASYLQPKITNDDYVCYGLQPFRDQNLQTVEDYVTVTDPADPKYYSTCWIRIQPGGFLEDTNITPKPIPTWAVGDQCMSCSFRDSLNNINVFSAPLWTNSLTDTCRNCDEPML